MAKGPFRSRIFLVLETMRAYQNLEGGRTANLTSFHLSHIKTRRQLYRRFLMHRKLLSLPQFSKRHIILPLQQRTKTLKDILRRNLNNQSMWVIRILQKEDKRIPGNLNVEVRVV